MRTRLVNGESRSFGFEITRQALELGDNVVATAWRPAEITAVPSSDRLLAQPLDVTDEAAARRAVDAAVERFGGIDVLAQRRDLALSTTHEEQ
jgi:NAD(P)-dependent dehydrogenase (short-subunit alcohol dehydrogenase family)